MFRFASLYVLVFGVLLVGACSNDQEASDAGTDYGANAARWVDEEFQPSTLSRAEQLDELGIVGPRVAG